MRNKRLFVSEFRFITSMVQLTVVPIGLDIIFYAFVLVKPPFMQNGLVAETAVYLPPLICIKPESGAGQIQTSTQQQALYRTRWFEIGQFSHTKRVK